LFKTKSSNKLSFSEKTSDKSRKSPRGARRKSFRLDRLKFLHKQQRPQIHIQGSCDSIPYYMDPKQGEDAAELLFVGMWNFLLDRETQTKN